MKTKTKLIIPGNLVSPVIPAQIVVNGEVWARYRFAAAKAIAADKEAKALKLETGLPETAQLVTMLGATAKESREAVVVNGNGIPIGKVSVFYREGFEMPSCFMSRVS